MNENLRLEWLHPSVADPNPLNWRRHPQRQLAALDTLIFGQEGVGWAGVVLINERRPDEGWPEGSRPTVIDGHARLKLALEKDEPVPALIGQWTGTQEKTILATLDPLGAMAETDAEMLDTLLGQIETDDAVLQAMLKDLAEEAGLEHFVPPPADFGDVPEPKLDQVKELAQKWQTAFGQLWEIPSKTVKGKCHRLLCGDATAKDMVTQLMQGQRAALFSTDPPYLVDYDGTNHPHKWNEPDKNKDWSDDYHDWDDAKQGEALYLGFIEAAIELALEEKAAWYCWHASRNQKMLEEVWEKFGAFVHQQIVWVKDRPVLTRSWYLWQHEPCFFGWIRGQKPKRVSEDYPRSVWQFNTIAPGETTLHPTSKPVELFAIPMEQHTDRGEICYEPFSGSGSQFVAGEKMGRLVYGLEKQPGFTAVILERLTEMGLEPRLVQ